MIQLACSSRVLVITTNVFRSIAKQCVPSMVADWYRLDGAAPVVAPKQVAGGGGTVGVLTIIWQVRAIFIPLENIMIIAYDTTSKSLSSYYCGLKSHRGRYLQVRKLSRWNANVGGSTQIYVGSSSSK